ncbi:MAG: diguanylate cyclase [Polyangiales bacterium]
MNLVSVFRAGRRLFRGTAAPLVALGSGAWIARGGFFHGHLGPVEVSLVAAGALGLVVRLTGPRLRRGQEAEPVDLGAASVGVSMSSMLTAVTGGASGPLAALPLLVVAAGAALSHPKRAWVLVAQGVALEGAMHLGAGGAGGLEALGLRSLLLVAAAALHHGLTRVEVARVRVHAKTLLDDERKRQKAAAQSFRLGAATAATASSLAQRRSETDDPARVQSSLEEIHASLVGLLTLARRTMGLRTCALFWSDAKGATLRLVEAASEDDLVTAPIPSGAGALGAVWNLSRPVALAQLRADYGGLPYYASPRGVRCFAGVPVLDQGATRGVLTADRDDDRPFTADEQQTLEAVALQARRLIDNERVFARLERARNDLAALFNASRALGEALTEEQCVQALTRAVKDIVEHDLLVFATYDAKTGEHRVKHVAGENTPAGLLGLVFGDNQGIASAAVKTKHALPYRGQYDPKVQYVFTRAWPLPNAASVLVLPLVVRDRVLGSLTLSAQRRGAFSEGARQLLGVLVSHASVALANAGAVRRLEEMATTDPMTGHLNKRSMETEFERKIRAAARFGRPLSVIVLDIDKFKSVNDTYGHATGDVVIKGLGAVLGRCKRETDIIARFGGEEFVVVCEETETTGAFQLAERIREELKRQVFQTEHGPLSVTCSLGIAEYPKDATERHALFERADQALYAAKQGGRNQTRTAAPMTEPAKDAKPTARKKDARATATPDKREPRTKAG